MRYLPILLALVLPLAGAAPRDVKTQAVHDYLLGIWGRQTIAGQADLTWRDATDMAQRVHDDTGKYPALMGYDFMNYVDATESDGRHQTEEAIAWDARGGLVSFHWHWRIGNGKFYTRETPFRLPVSDYRQIDADIDRIAQELRRLQDANVPVLWRPLHEASGGWFWWGTSREGYIQLWRHMHQRLTQTHGLHNLIWVWNGQDPAWYPGDDVVDISGYDIYDEKDRQAYGSQVATYRTLQQHAKPIALTETGYIPDPARMAADGAWWLWFMVWNDGAGPAGITSPDNFWTGEYYNTAAHKRKVYNDPRVITLDRLPKF
jgi:mannan endo-1,4-beta-mannosidase